MQAARTGRTRESSCNFGPLAPWPRSVHGLAESQSTLYVALDRAAVKKSIWLRRRAGILQDGVEQLEIAPLKIAGDINPADAETKYLPYEAWRKLLEYSNNFGAGAGM